MHIIFCERAENNADGTYSIHRGGLDVYRLEVPGAVRVAALIETTAEEVPAGTCVVELEIVDPDGKRVGSLLASATSPEGLRHTRFLLELGFGARAHGRHEVLVRIGKARGAAAIWVAPPRFS